MLLQDNWGTGGAKQIQTHLPKCTCDDTDDDVQEGISHLATFTFLGRMTALNPFSNLHSFRNLSARLRQNEEIDA